MPQFHIDEVYPKSDFYPYIVNFQNGYATDNLKPTECIVYENENGKNNVVTEITELLYNGGEIKEELGKTLMLARNKKNGKVRIIEVGNVEVKPVMKSNLNVTQMLETSNLELGRKFGSKKQKTRLEQSEKLKLNEQSVTEQMQNVTANLTEEQLEIPTKQKVQVEDFYLPPINKESKSPADVYPLDGILPEELYTTVHEEIACTDFKAKLLPIIQKHLKEDASDRIHVLAYYCSVLFDLATKPAKDVVNKKYVPAHFSPSLSQHIIENFLLRATGTNRISRPLQYKDKTICHAIVCLLVVSNFKFDLEELCSNTKLPFKMMAVKMAMTGAWVQKSGDVHYAILKLPLNKVATKRKSLNV